MLTLMLALTSTVGIAGCAGAGARPTPAPGGFPRSSIEGGLEATLAVRCSEGTAMVYVDDAIAGPASELGKRPIGLRAGFHRVEVRAEGKLAAFREVTLRRGENATLSVELRPDLDLADTARGR